jgi:competence protein ComEC
VLRLSAPKAAAIAAFAAAAFYSALAGFAIPTQRALVMLAAGLGALWLDRRTAPAEVLALALLAVLVLDPLAVLSFGFWLSFAAVAIILYVLPGVTGAGGLRGRVRAFARMQWAVAIGMLPLTLALFQSAALAGPLANAIAIPVVELVVIPATLIGVVVSGLPDALAALPFQLAAASLEGLWLALEPLSRLDHSQWVQPTPPLWTLIAAGIGIAWLLAPRGFPARWVGGVWLLPMLLVRPPAPVAGEVWFTLLDVGQGLAAVVRTAGHTLVYDTGPRWSSRFDAGRAAVAPFLRHAGVERIDALVVSHGDNDHIGGAAALLESFPVGRVLTSVPLRLSGAVPCRAGERWEWDEVRFELLHPAAETALRGNNVSCVLLVSGPYGRILLPGDLAAAGERELVARAGERLRAEWLVVPHHGARGSSSAAFVAAVRPAQALIAAGYRNAFRHPHPAVLARYHWIGARLHATAGEGALTARLGADGAQFSVWRAEQPRSWRAPALPPDAAL